MVTEAKFYQHCGGDAQIRDACKANGTRLSRARVAFRMRKDVYDVVARYAETDEAKALPEREAWFLQSLLQDFKRSGLALAEGEQARLESLLAQDTEACAEYGRNLAEDATKLVFKLEELRGLPPDFLDARKNADGLVVLTTKGPDSMTVMRH